jgi:hypothetical protein
MERIRNNPSFQAVQSTVDWLSAEIQRKDMPEALTWQAYLKGAQESQRHLRVFRAVPENTESVYVVRNSVSKDERLIVDEYAREVNHRWMEKLKSDIYLIETYHILSDFITATGKL